jgi:NAD(P)H-hydrate epimerase
MLKIVTVAAMRDIDRFTTERFAMSSILLMENAAQAAALEIKKRLGEVTDKEILIICGKGNNGGDGAATARQLCALGAHVDVVLLGRIEETKGDAGINFDIVQTLSESGHVIRESSNTPIPTQQLFLNSSGSLRFFQCTLIEEWRNLVQNKLSKNYCVYVDAVFGTGLTRPLEGLQKEAVAYLNRIRTIRSSSQEKLIVSLDIPSGLNADLPNPIGDAVYADLTIAFTSPMPANFLPPASHFNGTLVIADIGSPAVLIDEAPSEIFISEKSDAVKFLLQTRYLPGSYKNTHGHVLIIAGSRGMTGAAVLCGNAAMSSGCGLVTVATSKSAQPIIAGQLMPEVMTFPLDENEFGAVSADVSQQIHILREKADAIAVGPGLSSQDPRTRSFVIELIEKSKKPIVVDADGLNVLADFPRHLKGSSEAPLVLTPHPGEMLRLINKKDNELLNDRIALANEFAVQKNAIVVLKGERTIMAAPDGRVCINSTGNAGVGTAGAGDTLTGIIVSFIAQAVGIYGNKADVFLAVVAALYIAGLAADIAAQKKGLRSLVASDICDNLSEAINSLDPLGEKP